MLGTAGGDGHNSLHLMLLPKLSGPHNIILHMGKQYQYINWSINQASKPASKQPINPSIRKSVGQSINRPISLHLLSFGLISTVFENTTYTQHNVFNVG
jgi:hypothetical protein